MNLYTRNKFKIILIQDNKELKTLGVYPNREKAQIAFKRLCDENKNVQIPMKFVNTKTIKDVEFHIAIIKKKESPLEQPTKLKNDYGEYVEHFTSSKDWYIFDILPYQMEEHFWVYGCHPKYDRKDFKWIYENKIKPKATDKYSFLNITLYVNKILIETFDTFDMIICKNKTDSIRVYNLIEQYAKNDKLRYIMFSGDGGTNTRKSSEMIDKISAHTGWNRKKCMRPTTRP